MDNNSYNSKIISILFWTFSKFKSFISLVFKKSEFCLKALDNWKELNSFVDSLEDKLVGYLANDNDFNKSIISKTKTKRLKTFNNAVKKFIVWFLISTTILFIFYMIPRLIERILPIVFDSNGTPYYILSELCNILKGFYKIIEIPVEIINIIFPALIGALIGYILTDGIDPLDNWFDKDIIDEYIIKDLEKKLVAYTDENKSRKIITCLVDEKNNNLITKYTYVIKQGSNEKDSWDVTNQFKKEFEKTLNNKDTKEIIKILKKSIVLEEYDKKEIQNNIETSVNNECETVIKDLTELLKKSNNKENEIKHLTEKLNWKNNDIVDEIRKKLYYFIDLGYKIRYNSNVALVICFTENQYTHDGIRKNYTPYIYINAVLLNEKPNNTAVCNWLGCNNAMEDESIKRCESSKNVFGENVYCNKHLNSVESLRKKLNAKLHKNFNNRVRKGNVYNLSILESTEPFTGITEDLKILKGTEKFYPYYGIQNFIARKPLSATQNDLDMISETIYGNICKIINVINDKDEENPKGRANPPTTVKEKAKGRANPLTAVKEKSKDEANHPTPAKEEPKDEEITEKVSISRIDKPYKDSLQEDDLDSNIIAGIMQEWLQKDKDEINEVKIINPNIRFTTNKLSKILPKKDGPFTNDCFYEIYVGKSIRCQLCIKLNKTPNTNKAMSESEAFCKNYNKIKEIYKCQENDNGWLNPYKFKSFSVKKSKEKLKDEVNNKMELWFKDIKEFEKKLEKQLKEKEQ